MRRVILFIVILLIAGNAVAQEDGISLGAGIIDPGSFSFHVSYFHSILLRQLYLDAGFKHLETGGGQPTDDFDHLYFSNVNHFFIGLRLGEYVFVNPKLSWNWYGKYNSLGWGISAGVLAPISEALSVGLEFGYDEIRLDRSLDRFGGTRPLSIGLICAFRIH